jgi:hypothetical protein
MSHNFKKAQAITRSPYINAYTDLTARHTQKFADLDFPLLQLYFNAL